MKKVELNLDNPIFVFYIDTQNMPSQMAQELINRYEKAFNIYSNITTWIISSDKTEVKCIFDGKFRKRDSELSGLIEEINNRIEILSNSNSFDDFKINVRNWRLESIIDNGDKKD
jgi:hypothetical protein